MSQYAESSGGRRGRSRMEAGRSSPLASGTFKGRLDPVGELSGFPLVRCPSCGQARVVEGRTKNKDSENHGRIYFKCIRNAFPKQCDYYRFEKEYFEELKAFGVILVRPSDWAVTEVDKGARLPQSYSAHSSNGDRKEKEAIVALERKVDNMMSIMKISIVCVVCMVLGCVLNASLKY